MNDQLFLGDDVAMNLKMLLIGVAILKVIVKENVKSLINYVNTFLYTHVAT